MLNRKANDKVMYVQALVQQVCCLVQRMSCAKSEWTLREVRTVTTLGQEVRETRDQQVSPTSFNT